jgi:proteic killer suppression protein
MIKNFKSRETNKIWQGEISLRLPQGIQHIARRKLRMLHNAKRIEDLRVPPNNRLEALKGNKIGEHSIRINKQWRICFRWHEDNAYDVYIEDYH